MTEENRRTICRICKREVVFGDIMMCDKCKKRIKKKLGLD
jgi:hypothetical protein